MYAKWFKRVLDFTLSLIAEAATSETKQVYELADFLQKRI